MSREERCVFVAESFAEAEMAAAFLSSEGVPASVIDASAVGGLEGLSLMAGASTGGLEVWVRDAAQAADGRRLLTEHAAELRGARKDRTGLIEVDCEECGAKVKFPAAEAGTVQECPNCYAYLDVPDPDEEEWDDDSEGEAEPAEDD